MSFKEDYIYGYEKYEKHFDKLCENASSILGNITQCGIIEVCKSGGVYIATNKPKFGELLVEREAYKLEPTFAYSVDIPEGFSAVAGDEGFEHLWGDQESFLGQLIDVRHGFYYTEKIDDETFRHYFFCSEERQIYNTLVRNTTLIKNFIMHFKEVNRAIFNDMQDRKVDMSKEKDNYFTQLKQQPKTEKERLVAFLHTLNLLDENSNLSDREFQCMKYYCQGLTSKTIGSILNISHKTVESLISFLKDKFKIHLRKELNEKIGVN